MKHTPLRRKTPLYAKQSFKKSIGRAMLKGISKPSRKPTVKRKKPGMLSRKKKLWRVFSAFIRARDKGVCFTCGKPGNQAGHFIPKSVSGLSLYFLEEAVHCQCFHCNINLSGNWLAYEEAMIRMYGKNRVEEIKALARTVVRFTPEDYENRIQEYTTKLEELSKPVV